MISKLLAFVLALTVAIPAYSLRRRVIRQTPTKPTDSAPVKPSPSEQVRGQYYLSNCKDILTAEPAGYDKMFVESARTESQVLQLMFDGGLIFSQRFIQAFFVALEKIPVVGPQVERPSELPNILASPESYHQYVAAHKKIATFWAQRLSVLAKMTDDDLIAFGWRVFEIEKEIATIDSTSSETKEVQFNQLTQLIDALKLSPHTEIVNETLGDLISQTLIGMAHLVVGVIPANSQIRIVWDRPQPATSADDGETRKYYGKEVFLQSCKYAPLIGLLIGGVACGIAWTSGAHMMTPALSGFGGGTLFSIGFGGLIYASDRADKRVDDEDEAAKRRMNEAHMAQELKKPAISGQLYHLATDPHVDYILPMVTKEERIDLANILASFSLTKFRDPHNSISVETACTMNTCELNPVQIAYIGDIDRIEIEGLLKRLKAPLVFASSLEFESSLRELLLDVTNDPNDYEKHMKLKNKLKEVGTLVQLSKDEEEQALTAVIAKIDAVKAALTQLREKPYTDDRNTPEEIARGKLLISRIDFDLHRFEEMEIDATRFKQSIDRLDRLVAASQSWLNELPKSAKGWLQYATRIKQQLDSIR